MWFDVVWCVHVCVCMCGICVVCGVCGLMWCGVYMCACVCGVCDVCTVESMRRPA